MLFVELLIVIALIGADPAVDPPVAPPVVRALYLGPRVLDMYGEIDPEVQQKVFDLADEGKINGIVFDVKHEDGRVLSLAATDQAVAFKAVDERSGTGLPAFLEEAGRRGIWRIGRVTAFKDIIAYHSMAWHRLEYPGCDWHTCWIAPHSRSARSYVIEIAVEAAPYFDEIMFDYVRYPLHYLYASPDRRVKAVKNFASEACEAVRAAGAHVSFTLFGGVAIWQGEQGIGQTVEMPGCADTVSPMIYPSHEGVERAGVDRLVAAAAQHWGGHRLRPWYEYHDHESQISSGEPYADAGWILWDPAGHALSRW